jgi:hypothetical protein
LSSKRELDFCFLTGQLSGPLTLLDCLDRFEPALARRESLVIHVVGASLYEMLGLIKWECKFAIPEFLLIKFHATARGVGYLSAEASWGGGGEYTCKGNEKKRENV